MSAKNRTYSEDLSSVLQAAREAAERENLSYVDLAHFVEGIAGVKHSIAARTLMILEVDLQNLSRIVHKELSRSTQISESDSSYSVEAKNALDRARELAESDDRPDEDSGDLLTGLLLSSEALVTVFEKSNVNITEAKNTANSVRADSISEEMSDSSTPIEFSSSARRAIGIAIHYAERVPDQHAEPGSEFILAGLLAIGRKRGQRYHDTSTWLWREILKQIDQKGDEVNEITILNFPQRYQIKSPATQAHKFSIDMLSDEGMQLINAASSCAKKTTGQQRISMRHLIGAILSRKSGAPPPQAQNLLKDLFPDMTRLRKSLLDHLIELTQRTDKYRLKDGIEHWRQIILGIHQHRVYTIDDAPALYDLLGREDLAESLATRLDTMHQENSTRSFFLHIDGPWGAGKTTLLNFLSAKLADDWLIVAFNAWREQRTGPPWWSLLSSLRRSAYENAKKSRAIVLRIEDFLISFSSIKITHIITLIITALLTIGLIIWLSAGNYSITNFGDIAKSLSAILALAATIWSGNLALKRLLMPGSPKSAKAYVETTSDPMEAIAFRFRKFIGRIRRPVAFFIDDLDRCSESYVVEFLEAIQTLVKEEPKSVEEIKKNLRKAPYFIVAADGRWIRASYEKAYSIFNEEISYPGRPLGYLFTEKAFQLTTKLPNVDPELQQAYLKQLLKIENLEQFKKEFEIHKKEATKIFKDGRTDPDILDKLGRAEKGSENPIFKQAVRGEAIKQMAKPEVVETTEHELQKFWDLLDPNPRSMKRFVNAFGVERALRTIERGDTVELEPLARWTVVLLRWPLLAELLQSDPSLVKHVGFSTRKKNIREDLKNLFKNPDVKRVIKGVKPEHGPPLDEELIRKCCGTFDYKTT